MLASLRKCTGSPEPSVVDNAKKETNSHVLLKSPFKNVRTKVLFRLKKSP